MEKSLHEVASEAAYRAGVIERLNAVVALLEFMAGVTVVEEGAEAVEAVEDLRSVQQVESGEAEPRGSNEKQEVEPVEP